MRIIAALLACAAAGVASAQTPAPLQGDFDGDGKPDTVQVNRETAGGKERVRVTIHLAAKPGEDFFVVSGPADKPPSIEIRPPGKYQVQAGRVSKTLTLTADSLQVKMPVQGCAQTIIKYWDPKIPAFASQSLADPASVQPVSCAPGAPKDPSQLLPAGLIPQPVGGDFDGDGKADQVRIVPVSDKMGQIVVELASRPYQAFQLGAYMPNMQTFEVSPPRTFKVRKGENETEDLTLATESVILTMTMPGREPRVTVSYWSNTDRTRFQTRALASP